MLRMKDAVLKALLAHAHGEVQIHLANVEIYLNNPVGIGEHSAILEEMKKWASQLSEAEEVITSLEKNFTQPPKLPKQ